MITEREILKELLLPGNKDWRISSIETDEINEEIFVKLQYNSDIVENKGHIYRIYDYRKERRWRHLDLWQYKTCLVAQLPRYKDSTGNFKTVPIPWAEEYERMTILLEKKRYRPCWKRKVRVKRQNYCGLVLIRYTE